MSRRGERYEDFRIQSTRLEIPSSLYLQSVRFFDQTRAAQEARPDQANFVGGYRAAFQ